jgi:hypothetical protein
MIEVPYVSPPYSLVPSGVAGDEFVRFGIRFLPQDRCHEGTAFRVAVSLRLFYSNSMDRRKIGAPLN